MSVSGCLEVQVSGSGHSLSVQSPACVSVCSLCSRMREHSLCVSGSVLVKPGFGRPVCVCSLAVSAPGSASSVVPVRYQARSQ
jgi:hypothetical protein